MLRFALLLLALALLALGANGLHDADKESQTDFIIAGVELAAGIALIGLAFVVGRRSGPERVAPETDSADRAEVIERLQRHTEALRRAEQQGAPSVDAGAAPAAPAPTAAVRLPSIMLLNMPDAASPADIESAPPLGGRDEVLARLREFVPDLEIDAKGRSEHSGPDHSVRLDLGEGDVVHTIVIEAAGGTGISMIRWVLENTGWRAFVPKSGRFIEPDALESVAIPNQD